MKLNKLMLHKRYLLGIALLFSSFFSVTTAQTNAIIDATIELYPTSVNSPEELSEFITRDFKTEESKVRAIYTWLIQNVAYNPDAYKLFNYSFKNYRERNAKEEKTRHRIINHTLQTGNAVCEGYAMVFEKLCRLQGIENYLVRGDTKTNFNDIGRTFSTNHMWNVAIVDGKSFLFDATWGAGKYTTKFIKEPSYYYYKIAPEHLINSHYPKQIEDAFLTSAPSKRTFFERPLLIKHGIIFSDIDSEQKTGVIQQELYDGAITFKVARTIGVISYSYGNETRVLDSSIVDSQDNSTIFTIPLALGTDKLLIYFDGKPALGYLVR
jgi:hypothetical protein